MPGLEAGWRGDVGDHVIAMEWSPDGSRLAAASVSGPIAIFDGESGDRIALLPGHGFGTTGLSWGRDGAYLASSGQDGTARVWVVALGLERSRIEAGAAWVEHVAYSPTGRFLAVAAGKRLLVRDAADAREISDLAARSTIAAVAWHPTADVIAYASYGRIDRLDAATARPLPALEWPGSMLAIAWSPDGRTIASGDQDASAHLWDVASGEPLRMWGYRTKVRELSWDATGRFLATGGGPQVTIWDRSGDGPQGTEPMVLRNRPAASVSALAFHADRPLLAVGDQSGALTLWEIGEFSERVANESLDSEVTRLSWAGGTDRLAAATADGTVLVRDCGAKAAVP